MPVISVRAVPSDRQETRNIYECPVYKTKIRGPTYVWTLSLKTKERPAKWVLAGVALLLSVWGGRLGVKIQKLLIWQGMCACVQKGHSCLTCHSYHSIHKVWHILQHVDVLEDGGKPKHSKNTWMELVSFYWKMIKYTERNAKNSHAGSQLEVMKLDLNKSNLGTTRIFISREKKPH